ncbi:hypothetical protein TcG_09025 [Trypanosoma cruzi]|nr:hypothetical protein TcG_09025 [Trypanosoma cruzi]
MHVCACRACWCCEEVQANSHYWAAGALFLSAQRDEQFFLHVTCWSASILPTGVTPLCRRSTALVLLTAHVAPCRLAYLQGHGLWSPLRGRSHVLFFSMLLRGTGE